VRYSFPSSDDGPLWALHLSALSLQALTAADELGLFDALAEAPAAPEQLADRLRLNRRAVRALLPVLASSGLLVQHLGRYHASETARNYLLRASPFYWGPVLAVIRHRPPSHQRLMEALKAPEASARWGAAVGLEPADAWSAGEVTVELAQRIAAYMHATSLAAALATARCVDLAGARKLLDVGAGSGCFGIAFAQCHPQLHCTLMDLHAMCKVAMEYVRAGGVADRVDCLALDMLREDWPHGYDAILLSNVLHDWSFDTCATLAAKAYAALPPRGRILLHEMLLDDTHDGPPAAAVLSLYMLSGTRGQQFTAAELVKLLSEAGFSETQITPTRGHFCIVDARRP
jgi:ubiquinone/menaquinone biosynthesis C-methylase UbiE